MPTGLQNKTTLLTFRFAHGSNVGVVADNSGYSLSGCANLTSIDLSYSSLNDSRLPIFNNESLTNINLYSSRVKGGRASDDNEDFVIHKETFASAPELTNLTIRSNRLLADKPIHPGRLLTIQNYIIFIIFPFVEQMEIYHHCFKSHGYIMCTCITIIYLVFFQILHQILIFTMQDFHIIN